MIQDAYRLLNTKNLRNLNSLRVKQQFNAPPLLHICNFSHQLPGLTKIIYTAGTPFSLEIEKYVLNDVVSGKEGMKNA